MQDASEVVEAGPHRGLWGEEVVRRRLDGGVEEGAVEGGDHGGEVLQYQSAVGGERWVRLEQAGEVAAVAAGDVDEEDGGGGGGGAARERGGG